MARRNHWGRPAPARIGSRAADRIALDCVGSDEGLRFLQNVSRRLNHRPEGIEIRFEVEIETELEPAVLAWVLVDRMSGEAVAEDLRPLHRRVARAARHGDLVELEALFAIDYVTPQAATAIARQRSAGAESLVRKYLEPCWPHHRRAPLLRAIGTYGSPSWELLIRGIADDDGIEWTASAALRDLEARRDAPEWNPCFAMSDGVRAIRT